MKAEKHKVPQQSRTWAELSLATTCNRFHPSKAMMAIQVTFCTLERTNIIICSARLWERYADYNLLVQYSDCANMPGTTELRMSMDLALSFEGNVREIFLPSAFFASLSARPKGYVLLATIMESYSQYRKYC